MLVVGVNDGDECAGDGGDVLGMGVDEGGSCRGVLPGTVHPPAPHAKHCE